MFPVRVDYVIQTNTNEYEYCEYEWNSPCDSAYKRIYPGDKVSWMRCTSRGECILKGKPLNPVPTTTTTTIPTGCLEICNEETISCFHSCKRCPKEYEYCEYEWNSPCGIDSGTLDSGEHMPWLVCRNKGTCVMKGCNLLLN